MKTARAEKAASKDAAAAAPSTERKSTGSNASPTGVAIWERGLGFDPPLRLPLQAKLAIDERGDEYEQEAEQVATQVSGLEGTAPTPSALRVRRQALAPTTPQAKPEIEHTISASLGRGHALAEPLRTPLERSMGADFRGVRVHTDAAADHLNESLGARAFTVGQDIYFRQGEFNPGARDGRTLLAHELVHVVQQNGVGVRIQRSPADPPPVPPPLTGPVELEGKGAFSPPAQVADTIKASLGNPVSVAVRFGALATGELPVIWNGVWFESAPPPPEHGGHPLSLHHEGFPISPAARPVLAINIDRGIVTGFLGWRTPAALARDPAQFFAKHPLRELFGLEGLETDPPDFAAGTNILSHGKLNYVQPVTFGTGVFDGQATVSLQDETYGFKGEVLVNEVKGIDKPLELKKEGAKLFAGQSWKFERSLGAGGKLSGEIIGTLAGGIPDVRGTLNYARTRPNVAGTVTVIVTTFDIAKENVRDELGADAPSTIVPAAPGDNLAIAGWGHVDFSFNEWLTGNADVIVHPEGYITAKGEIVPTVVIPIVKKREAEDKPLFSGSVSKAIPSLDAIVADVAVKGSLDITGYASLGPGTMYDLRVAGLFSTHPEIVNTFELSGVISVPAIAGIKALAKGGIVAQVWLGKTWEVARVGITIEGNLALQLYAEAAAAAGRRKGDDDEPEYFIKGKLQGGAGLKLDLNTYLSGEFAFWSKHIELFNRTYTIAGGSVTIDFDYVIGNKKKKGEDVLKLSVDLGAFDSDAFVDAVLRGETVEDKKYKGKDQAEGELDTVPNPAAPAPVAPPDPTQPIAPGTPIAAIKTFTETFKMEGAGHTLKLTLADPPDLAMESVLEPLLRKVDRARKDVKKDKSLSTAEKTSRIAALDKIEASARGVQAAAARAAKNPAYITPQVPGFEELAQLIGDYGDAYDVSDLGIALDKVIVDPSKPETVLTKYPDLATSELVRAQVARIIANGVDAMDLRKVVDNVRPVKEDNVLDMLGLIDKMIAAGAANWNKVITDLRIGGNKYKGASFVIHYIDANLGWDNVGFELGNDPLDTSGRRWDAWVAGTLYQFKSWYTWPNIADRTFLRQILEDYRLTRVGDEMGLKWVFETSLTREEIIRRMKDALSEVMLDLKQGQTPKVDGYTGSIALFIFARVDSIVVKT